MTYKSNIVRPSLLAKIHRTNRTFLLKNKRPIKSFKKSFKPSHSLKTQIKRQNTAVLHSGLTKDMMQIKKIHESAIKTANIAVQKHKKCKRKKKLIQEEIKSPSKVIGITKTKNYTIEEYKNPPKKYIIGWRRKKIKDKDGYEHIINLALVKDPKTGKIKTVRTSIWHPKEEPKAKKLGKYAHEK